MEYAKVCRQSFKQSFVVLYAKRQQATEIFHLSPRQIMLRVGWQTRIVNRYDFWVLLQKVRDLQSIFLMRIHASGQSCHTSDNQPRIEGADHTTVVN